MTNSAPGAGSADLTRFGCAAGRKERAEDRDSIKATSITRKSPWVLLYVLTRMCGSPSQVTRAARARAVAATSGSDRSNGMASLLYALELNVIIDYKKNYRCQTD